MGPLWFALASAIISQVGAVRAQLASGSRSKPQQPFDGSKTRAQRQLAKRWPETAARLEKLITQTKPEPTTALRGSNGFSTPAQVGREMARNGIARDGTKRPTTYVTHHATFEDPKVRAAAMERNTGRATRSKHGALQHFGAKPASAFKDSTARRYSFSSPPQIQRLQQLLDQKNLLDQKALDHAAATGSYTGGAAHSTSSIQGPSRNRPKFEYDLILRYHDTIMLVQVPSTYLRSASLSSYHWSSSRSIANPAKRLDIGFLKLAFLKALEAAIRLQGTMLVSNQLSMEMLGPYVEGTEAILPLAVEIEILAEDVPDIHKAIKDACSTMGLVEASHYNIPEADDKTS